jgi:TetR/AcrR family transcriptional repressor of nem operon
MLLDIYQDDVHHLICQAPKERDFKMRVSQEEKDRSHTRIIASAAKLLRKHGVDRASVGDVMSDAGLTHGGFYKHFESKDELVAAAIDKAFEDITKILEAGVYPGFERDPPSDFRAYYLSNGHVATPEIGCPIASIGNDIARSAFSLKEHFGSGVRRIVGLLAQGYSRTEKAKRNRAIRDLAMMAGAVMIARASDEETAREVLSACRHGSV